MIKAVCREGQAGPAVNMTAPVANLLSVQSWVKQLISQTTGFLAYKMQIIKKSLYFTEMYHSVRHIDNVPGTVTVA